MDHGGLLRRSSPGSEPVFILYILLLLIARVVVWLSSLLGCGVLHTILPTLVGSDMFLHQPQPSLIPVTTPVPPLSTQHALIHSSIFPTSPPHTHFRHSGIGSLSVLHYHCNELVQGFWFLTHHHYWTIPKTLLGYPTVVRSHGDPASLILQNRLLHELQQPIDGADVGVH